MRFELAGTLIRPSPIVLRYDANANFVPAGYIIQEYTHFEVICIGAGGGMGGGIDTGNTGTTLRSYGGAGGGGGYHRVRGLLSALPSLVPIIVGIGGAIGTDHNSNPSLTTDGSDGGYSSFKGTTCQASGGKGGGRVQTNSSTVGSFANGGDGGVGNRIIAGGGAVGGLAGTRSPQSPGTNGADGTLFNNIGKGGGGGAGGFGQYGFVTPLSLATSGGKGSYNPGDMSVYCPGDGPSDDIGIHNIIPGGAGGAKASPLNGLPTVYGFSQGQRLPGANGIVIVRLTSE